MSPGPVELQTPYLDAATTLQALASSNTGGGVPACDQAAEVFHPAAVQPAAAVAPASSDQQPTPKQAQILELWDRGLTDKKALSQQVYGRVGGMQYRLIEETLARFGRL
jgi:hypothetical protein